MMASLSLLSWFIIHPEVSISIATKRTTFQFAIALPFIHDLTPCFDLIGKYIVLYDKKALVQKFVNCFAFSITKSVFYSSLPLSSRRLEKLKKPYGIATSSVSPSAFSLDIVRISKLLLKALIAD